MKKNNASTHVFKHNNKWYKLSLRIDETDISPGKRQLQKNRVSLYSLYGVSGKQLKEDSQNNMLPMHLDGLDIRIIGMRIQRRNGDLHPDMKG